MTSFTSCRFLTLAISAGLDKIPLIASPEK
jgi:hypothetical protein